MRIIAGTLGGRRFYPPGKGWPTRPTTDIAKEGLYNILQGRLDFDAVKFLDLFGGTGSHCFEMISRGCTSATYVDKFKPACDFVRKQSIEWGIDEYIRVIQMDVFRYCAQRPGQYGYIFAGPPYGLKELDTLPDVVLENSLMTTDGFLVLEHNPNHDFTKHPHFTEVRRYGETHFSFFTPLAI
jgi:16S rRNA (guanine(966)-N(2))-methyltransferase RsmD